jgi:hypothetical protein
MDEVAEAAQQARRLVAMNLPSEELHEGLERDHGLSFMPAAGRWPIRHEPAPRASHGRTSWRICHSLPGTHSGADRPTGTSRRHQP